MADRRRLGIEREKGIYTKRWRVESRDNPVTSWCTSSWTQKKVEDNRASNEKLLVASGN